MTKRKQLFSSSLATHLSRRKNLRPTHSSQQGIRWGRGESRFSWSGVIGVLIPDFFVPPRRAREKKKRIQYQDVRERRLALYTLFI